MRTTPAIARPPADPDALIREARRRQRIRYALTAAACLAVLGCAAGLCLRLLGTAHPRPHSTKPQPSPVPSHHPATAPIPPLPAKVLMWPLGLPLGVGNYAGPPFVVANVLTATSDRRGRLLLTPRWGALDATQRAVGWLPRRRPCLVGAVLPEHGDGRGPGEVMRASRARWRDRGGV